MDKPVWNEAWASWSDWYSRAKVWDAARILQTCLSLHTSVRQSHEEQKSNTGGEESRRGSRPNETGRDINPGRHSEPNVAPQ